MVGAHNVPEPIRDAARPAAPCGECGGFDTLESLDREVKRLEAMPIHPSVIVAHDTYGEPGHMTGLASPLTGGAVTKNYVDQDGLNPGFGPLVGGTTYNPSTALSVDYNALPTQTCADCGHTFRPYWKSDVTALRQRIYEQRLKKLHPLEVLAHETEVKKPSPHSTSPSHEEASSPAP